MKPTFGTFRPAKGKIFVSDLEVGMLRTPGGIILTDDNMKDRGIRARWGKVVMVGEGVEEDHQVSVGDWVLIEHGRWSYGFPVIDDETGKEITVWHIENKAMIVACDENPRREVARF